MWPFYSILVGKFVDLKLVVWVLLWLSSRKLMEVDADADNGQCECRVRISVATKKALWMRVLYTSELEDLSCH